MNAYLVYIKKTINWLIQLSKRENISPIWVFWDYAWAVILHRCLIRQYVIGEFWKKSNPERKKCMTYSRIVKLFDRYNCKEYIHYLNDKSEFNIYFKEFINREWLHSTKISEEDITSFIKRHSTFIIKPLQGVEGGGISKITLKTNQESDITALYNKLKNQYVLIEQAIIQNKKMVFGNTSVNTIRTHTFLGKDGKAHVIKAILRAGVGDTVVDNYAQGGSIYEVDIDYGIVCTKGKSKNGADHIYHPGTDIIMLGYKIPNWKKVIKLSCEAAEKLPQIRFIGWDIAITDNDVELIEGNHNPDYELLEFLGSNEYYSKIKQLI